VAEADSIGTQRRQGRSCNDRSVWFFRDLDLPLTSLSGVDCEGIYRRGNNIVALHYEGSTTPARPESALRLQGERRVMPFFNVLFGGRLRRYISCTALHCYLELSATVWMEILLPLAGCEGIYPEATYVVGTQVTNCRRLRRDRIRQGASSRVNILCDRHWLQGYICPGRKYRSLMGCPTRR